MLRDLFKNLEIFKSLRLLDSVSLFRAVEFIFLKSARQEVALFSDNQTAIGALTTLNLLVQGQRNFEFRTKLRK